MLFSADHWEFMESFQPYHGTTRYADAWSGPYVHPLSLLRDATNDDKHRITDPVLLIPNQFFFSEPLEVVQREETFFEGSTVLVSDWNINGMGAELNLGDEVMRIRLGPNSEPGIDHAGEFTPAGSAG